MSGTSSSVSHVVPLSCTKLTTAVRDFQKFWTALKGSETVDSQEETDVVRWTFQDGTVLEEEVVEAPLGHRLRREEAKPEILSKFKRHLGPHFSAEHVDKLVKLAESPKELDGMDIDEYVDLYVQK